jgi:hypothetical protein
VRSPVLVAFATALGLSLTAIPPAHAADRESAQRLLNSLPVSSEHSNGFVREAFADWLDRDGNGCDTREDVLIAERLAGTVAGCDVIGGRWLSSYDGQVTRSPGRFDIDHRVPLEEAWASGAWRWTSSTRDRYANDLGYAASLLAVSLGSNRSKGAREPGEWMPPLAGQRCSYVKLWIGVKYRWRLAVDSSEKSALTGYLRGCDPRMAVPRRAVVHTRWPRSTPVNPRPDEAGEGTSPGTRSIR